ncbi:MAG: hypothetical protein HOP12_16305 [Candidatus Eisenbacteria bacterium]|uniref:DUF5666 domain-containing protein n=1 Tax=Eiseniibacteriota bacterium TaxID=2212470 RepID=A0A849SSQ0_UNCEI|nr:hypothetical protein [Candidatus Eisenbacteria bacterium]
MIRPTAALLALVLAAVSRCSSSAPLPPPHDAGGSTRPSGAAKSSRSASLPRPGDNVKLRGVLSEDVDCRLLKAENGETYSLSSKLPSLLNGSRVCVHGTISEVSQCLTQPSIEVSQVRNWSSCP